MGTVQKLLTIMKVFAVIVLALVASVAATDLTLPSNDFLDAESFLELVKDHGDADAIAAADDAENFAEDSMNSADLGLEDELESDHSASLSASDQDISGLSKLV